MDFLVNILSKFVDGFKTKNPVVFIVIQLLLGVGFFAVDQALTTTVEIDPGQVTDLVSGGLRNTFEWVQKGIVFLMAILGAHTPKNIKVGKALYEKKLE